MTLTADRQKLEALYRLRTLKLAVSRQAMSVYRRDPVAWANDLIRWPTDQRLAVYQADALSALADKKRVALRGPRGMGKTMPEALSVLWFATTRDGDDWKVPTTAGVWRQLSRFLWPEIHKWARKLDYRKLARPPFSPRTELLKLNLQLSTGEAFALASDVPDLLEGAHADHILAVIDEGKSINEASWDAVEGYFASPGEALSFAGSTPGAPLGRFYDICSAKPGFEDWHAIHVSIDLAINEGRVNPEWAEQRRLQWGEDSALYRNYVLAEFAGDEDSAIPLAWVEAAMDRWEELSELGQIQSQTFIGVGVDPADTGQDSTVLAFRFGWVIDKLRYHDTPQTDIKEYGSELMATAGRVKGVLDAHGGYAVVDVIGVGAGVIGKLREEVGRARVQAFNASEGTDWHDSSRELSFVNTRSAAWWKLRELLSPDSDVQLALPPDDRLKGDLTAPRWLPPTASGKIRLESKEEIGKRIGRSTDAGDAVVMAFWKQQGKVGWSKTTARLPESLG